MQNILDEVYEIKKSSATAYVGTVDREGMPVVREVAVIDREQNIKTQYLKTNTSFKNLKKLLNGDDTSIYYCNDDLHKGVLFKGTMEILDDEGVPKDQCVLKFTAHSGNFYHGLRYTDFNITEDMV